MSVIPDMECIWEKEVTLLTVTMYRQLVLSACLDRHWQPVKSFEEGWNTILFTSFLHLAL